MKSLSIIMFQSLFHILQLLPRRPVILFLQSFPRTLCVIIKQSKTQNLARTAVADSTHLLYGFDIKKLSIDNAIKMID